MRAIECWTSSINIAPKSSCFASKAGPRSEAGEGAEIQSCPVLFSDDNGARANMTRVYGYASVGQRVVSNVSHGHWKTCILLGAVHLGDRILFGRSQRDI